MFHLTKVVTRLFFTSFFGPLGLPISPDLLRWWALEVPEYVDAPTALNLRQIRQTVDPGKTNGLLCQDNVSLHL
jgi:hypothetical protein